MLVQRDIPYIGGYGSKREVAAKPGVRSAQSRTVRLRAEIFLSQYRAILDDVIDIVILN
jgi:hypothetical protein